MVVRSGLTFGHFVTARNLRLRHMSVSMGASWSGTGTEGAIVVGAADVAVAGAAEETASEGIVPVVVVVFCPTTATAKSTVNVMVAARLTSTVAMAATDVECWSWPRLFHGQNCSQMASLEASLCMATAAGMVTAF